MKIIALLTWSTFLSSVISKVWLQKYFIFWSLLDLKNCWVTELNPYVAMCSLFAVRIWDVRPFAPQERCVKVLQGHQHTFEKVRNCHLFIDYFFFFFDWCLTPYSQLQPAWEEIGKWLREIHDHPQPAGAPSHMWSERRNRHLPNDFILNILNSVVQESSEYTIQMFLCSKKRKNGKHII